MDISKSDPKANDSVNTVAEIISKSNILLKAEEIFTLSSCILDKIGNKTVSKTPFTLPEIM